MLDREFIVLLLLLYQLSFGQSVSEKLIHGKIKVESGSAAGVTIVNLVNEKSAISDSDGFFSIRAKVDDLLVFSSVNLEYHRRLIEEDDLKSDLMIIKITAKITELDEIIVNKHPEINAVALGISPKGIVKLTPAERRVYTALSTPGDAFLNYLSGRTAMLKKEIEVEKKNRNIAIMNTLFEENYFTTSLKMPAEYVKGFLYFCAEDKVFEEVLKTKDKSKIEFLIVPLATKYKGFISEITSKP